MGSAATRRDLASMLATRHPGVVDAFCWNPNLSTDPRIHELVPAELLVPSTALAGRTIDVFHVTSPFEHVGIDELLPRSPGVEPGRHVLRPDPVPIPGSLPDPARPLGISRPADDARRMRRDPHRFGVGGQRLRRTAGHRSRSADRHRWWHQRSASERPTDRTTRSCDCCTRRCRTSSPGSSWCRRGWTGARTSMARSRPTPRFPTELQLRHQLVINCRVTHHERRLLERVVEAAECDGDVVITGYVSDDDLVRSVPDDRTGRCSRRSTRGSGFPCSKHGAAGHA